MNKLPLHVTIGTIKIGRKEYLIKEGDYILFNGACYQFCAGDKRTLKCSGWSLYSSVVIPKTTVARIDLSLLRKEVTGTIEKRTLLVKYYF